MLSTAISPLSMACYTDDPMLQLAAGHRYARNSIGIPADARSARHEVTPATRRPGRLRVGYVSSDLRHHAVGFSLTDLMETHDRSAVEGALLIAAYIIIAVAAYFYPSAAQQSSVGGAGSV